MTPLWIGTDVESLLRYYLNRELLRTHLWLPGATGTGKSTSIISMLIPLMMSPAPMSAIFLVDPVGNLCRDLLLWMASEGLCPQYVRDRLVYWEPAREGWVLPFNPLRPATEDQLYYQVGRSLDIVLRGFAAQRTEEMPRLRYWTFACFFALAAMGLPISACRWLLRPGTPEHLALLQKLPASLQAMWADILQSRSGEAMKQLESTRSRLSLFSDCGILRRTFGSSTNHFDVRRFIDERRIVLCNVGSYGVLNQQIARTIGGFIVNEVIQTAMSMSPKQVDPTYLVLDEFQHFVGVDLYDALPLVRQLGLRLMLAHQSLSQLKVGEVDLSGIIWQARSRLIFANDAEDADLLANELATLTFDPMKLKEVLHTQRQRIIGHRRETTHSTTTTNTTSRANDRSRTMSEGESSGRSKAIDVTHPTVSTGKNSGWSTGTSEKSAVSDGYSHTEGETFLPIHEDFVEVASKTFQSFDEHRLEFAKRIRLKPTGERANHWLDDLK